MYLNIVLSDDDVNSQIGIYYKNIQIGIKYNFF